MRLAARRREAAPLERPRDEGSEGGAVHHVRVGGDDEQVLAGLERHQTCRNGSRALPRDLGLRVGHRLSDGRLRAPYGSAGGSELEEVGSDLAADEEPKRRRLEGAAWKKPSERDEIQPCACGRPARTSPAFEHRRLELPLSVAVSMLRRR